MASPTLASSLSRISTDQQAFQGTTIDELGSLVEKTLDRSEPACALADLAYIRLQTVIYSAIAHLNFGDIGKVQDMLQGALLDSQLSTASLEKTMPMRCSKVDAHVHADTIDYGNFEGRTVFWLTQHPGLVEFEAAALKRRWEAALELITELKAICAEAESWHTMHGHEKNSVQCDSICARIPSMRAAIRKAEGK